MNDTELEEMAKRLYDKQMMDINFQKLLEEIIANETKEKRDKKIDNILE